MQGHYNGTHKNVIQYFNCVQRVLEQRIQKADVSVAEAAQFRIIGLQIFNKLLYICIQLWEIKTGIAIIVVLYQYAVMGAVLSY